MTKGQEPTENKQGERQRITEEGRMDLFYSERSIRLSRDNINIFLIYEKKSCHILSDEN
jgi:hypothetical protein